MGSDNKSEYDFLDKISLKDIFVDSVREVVSTLDSGTALAIKYSLVDGLSADDVIAKYDKDSVDDFKTYAQWMDESFPDGEFDFPPGNKGGGYYDCYPDYREAVVYDVMKDALSDIKSTFRDKLFDTWTSEYEKQNGCLPRYCGALKNFDSLSKSGWFDDVSNCDLDVKACIADSLNTRWPRVDPSVVETIKQRCADDKFVMSDRERKSCENFLNWHRDNLRDCVSAALTKQAMFEIADSLHMRCPTDLIYLGTLEYDTWRHHKYDSPYCAVHDDLVDSGSIPGIDDLVTRFRDDISSAVDFGAIESKAGGVLRLPPNNGVRIWNLSKDAAKSFVADKQHWDSIVDFVADSMLKYGDKDCVADICDGSYKDKAWRPSVWLTDVGYKAARNMGNNMRKEMRDEIKDMMAPNGSLDSDKLMSRVLEPGFGSDPDRTPMENLFAALCGRMSKNFHKSNDFNFGVVPAYGRGIDFDDIARVSGTSDIGGSFHTIDDIKNGIDGIFARVENSMSDLISREAVFARLDFDAERRYRRIDVSHEIEDIEDDLAAALKDCVSKNSPLPDTLKNAVDNLDGGSGDDDDKQIGE